MSEASVSCREAGSERGGLERQPVQGILRVRDSQHRSKDKRKHRDEKEAWESRLTAE